MRLQAPWVNDLASGLLAKDVETVRGVMTALRERLESPGQVD